MDSKSINDTCNECEMETTGFKVNLREPLKGRMLCPFCKLLMRNPIQTSRGELACKYCYKQNTRHCNVCPIDGEPLVPDEVFDDRYKAKEILRLKCFCNNNKYGCEWQGIVREVESHARICECKPVNCFFCMEEISRTSIHSHIEICEKIPTDGKCIFPECTYKVTNIHDLISHLEKDVVNHNLLHISVIKMMHTKFNSQLEIQKKDHEEKETYLEAKIKTLEDKVSALMMTLTQFQNGYENTISHLQEQIDTLQSNKQSIVESAKKEDSSILKNDISNSVKILGQNISDLNLRQQLSENTSYNGKLLWKIDNVSGRMHQSIIGKVTALHSAPIFFDRYSYKFCGRLYLNGDGVGRCTHVSVFFVLMKSEYDNLLQWPFKKRVTIRLINQIDLNEDVTEYFDSDMNSSSFMKPKKDMNVAAGIPLFITRESFLNGGFVKDDTAFIELSVSDVAE